MSPPPVGQAFIDQEGICWCVRKVINSPSLPGFFLVRLDHDAASESMESSLVLAPLEFQALHRARGFKAIAPAETGSAAVVPGKVPGSTRLWIDFAETDAQSALEPREPRGA